MREIREIFEGMGEKIDKNVKEFGEMIDKNAKKIGEMIEESGEKMSEMFGEIKGDLRIINWQLSFLLAVGGCSGLLFLCM